MIGPVVLVGAFAFALGLVLFSEREAENGVPNTSRSGVEYRAYFPTSGDYETVLPTGEGWSRSAEALINGAIQRTSVRGPSGLELVIDSTPSEPATFSLKAQADCRRFSSPAFALAEACTFQGGRFARCQASPCVNYLLNLSESGPGYAVLGGGPDREVAQSVADRVARSLRPR